MKIAYVIMLLAVSISSAERHKDCFSEKPIIVYGKDGSIRSGFGQLKKPRGSEFTGVRELEINGTKVSASETDSIQFYNIKGYSENGTWLFKVINGKISAFVLNIWNWLSYPNYPALACSTETPAIVDSMVLKKSKDYIRNAIAYQYWNHLSSLKKTIQYISIGNKRINFNDSVLQEIVKGKTTSYLYTQKYLSKLHDPSLLAIPDFNQYAANTQVLIDSLYNVLLSLKKDSRQYKQTNDYLKRAFITYDDYNIVCKHTIYVSNSIAYLKSGKTLSGHIRLAIDTTDFSYHTSLLFPNGSPFKGTINIDDTYERLKDCPKKISKIIVGGFKLNPSEIDSVIFNSYYVNVDNGSWIFRER